MGGTTTGLGDLNLIDLFLFPAGHMEIGLGPQLTFPTATENAIGTGKWQAGAAGVLIAPQKWGLLGALVTWQHSFAGGNERLAQDNLTAQPLALYHLPKQWYLRSTATWNFDLERGPYSIPLGAGVGHVRIVDHGTTINLFAEPQWTVAHNGIGQPKFQLFTGLNLQFSLHHK